MPCLLGIVGLGFPRSFSCKRFSYYKVNPLRRIYQHKSPKICCRMGKQTMGGGRCIAHMASSATNHRIAADASTRLLRILRALVLVAAAGLVMLISWDAFHNRSFVANAEYLYVQLWVCLFLMADAVAELCLSPRKLRYVATHVLLFIVSIPYLNIIDLCGWQFDPIAQYLMRFMPLLRAGYVMALVARTLFSNKATSLLATYLMLLGATVYFASLVFFIEEHGVNPDVTTYWAALWWAAMDVTTVGCNISCTTTVGKLLGVILAAEGLMMFPLFTVFIVDSLTRRAARGRRATPPANR